MASTQERLRELCIRLRSGERPDVCAEVARIAQVLQRRGVRRVGLAAAAENVGVPAIALQMGLAMVDITGSPTGVVDVTGTWMRPPSRQPHAKCSWSFEASWLTDKLALLTPCSFGAGTVVRKLEALVRAETSGIDLLVVDLTGLVRTGEHLAAITLLHGVAVVAYSGRTTSSQLETWMRDIPADKNLGVLLVGV